MKRFRTAVVAIVAVTTLGLGTTSCTPAEQAAFGTGLSSLLYFIVFATCNCFGDPVGPGLTPTTLPPAPPVDPVPAP